LIQALIVFGIRKKCHSSGRNLLLHLMQVHPEDEGVCENRVLRRIFGPKRSQAAWTS
jgi:hypothetical protein